MRTRTIWLIWALYTLLWTTALVLPKSAMEVEGLDELISGYRLYIAKTVHVGAYAVWAVLTALLPVSVRYRWLLVFFLMGHATATELIQEHVPGRSGHLHDVALDQLGITLGLLAGWRWWTK